MKFGNTAAIMMIPDGATEAAALQRVTHLGIGAHPDDLEFMALHGILACYKKKDAWFGGVTCTNGAGSTKRPGGTPRPTSNGDLVRQRHAEQEEAARIGEYSFIAQLGYTSAEAKDMRDDRLTRDLVAILQQCRPHTIYTHNPADKHDTHVAVLVRVIKALRSLPISHRPARLLGCEVWRDLDWLDDKAKVRLDVSAHPALAEKLAAAFASQNQAKRYDLAVRGRERANATFHQSHDPDQACAVWHAMDLTPLMQDDSLSIRAFTAQQIDNFKTDVLGKISALE